MSTRMMRDPLPEGERTPDALAKTKKRRQTELKDVTWITHQMAKQFDMSMFLATYAREVAFYLVLVICITVAAVGMARPTMYLMAQGLRAQMVDHAGIPYPDAEDTSRVKFHDINTVDDMWDYLEMHLVPLMYPQTFAQSRQYDKGIGTENVLIGVPVIRQVMVTKTECQNPFPRVFKDCYPKYSKKTTSNKAPEESPWKYKKAKETQGAVWPGRVTNYLGDGFQEEFGRTLDEGMATVRKLKTGKFVQEGTRAIFVDIAYYNAHVNLFTAVKISFELPPTGCIIPTANFYTLNLIRYVTTSNFLVLACEIIFILLIVFYIAAEIREFIFFRTTYFECFFNYVDVGVIICGSLLFIFRIIQYIEVVEVLSSIQNSVDAYNSLQSIARQETVIKNTMAVTVFLVYFNLFKYISFNKAMVEIHNALYKSLNDIGGFLLSLLVVLIGFALFGALSFGTQLWDFSTLALSLFTLLRILMGDFSYNNLLEADSIIAPIFFMLYLGVVFFIFLNLFLSIIYDCYGDVRMEGTLRPEEQYMTDFWGTAIYNLMELCGCKDCAPRSLVVKKENKTEEDIIATLKRCGFTDIDIEMFMSRYNIHPDAKVRTRDVDKLMDNLKSEVPSKADPSLLTQEPAEIPAYVMESTKAGMGPPKELMSSRAPTVAMNDFAAQQERLDKVESVMASIAEKLDILLKKLNAVDARKLPLD